jgi:transcription-repair coupling factor (superfamily II helicase)
MLVRLPSFVDALKRGDNLIIEGLWDSPKAILATLAQRETGKNILIITSGVRESRLYDDFAYFGAKNVREFPAWETLPSEGVPPSPDVVGERYAVLRDIGKEPLILLAPLQACVQRVISPERLKAGSWEIKVGDEVPFEDLVQLLVDDGYQRRPVAADKGEFAVRGGILDLWSVDSPDAYRIEFFGDQIEGIRIYDPVGQRSIRKVEHFAFTPAQEMELLDEGAVSLFDYLGPDTIVIFDELAQLDEASHLQHLYWPADDQHDLNAKRWTSPFEPLPELLGGLTETPERGLTVHFVCENDADEEHLRRQLVDEGIHLPADTPFERGYLSSGFVLQQAALCVVPVTEITGRYKVRRKKQRSTYHTQPSDYQELKPGDLVTHFHHGVGRYLGTEKRLNHEGNLVEFLSLEYADQGKLFIPATQSHLVSKYIGSGEEKPVLNKIGSGKWQKLRVKTEAAIRDYAAQLLRMHAERQLAPGHAFPPDDADMERFEREFPYVETDDQLRAIRAIKEDMESVQAMDRLVCGDVGYGKTEVAMRAAAKAAAAGKQVAVLVPTTVLAMQHFENFTVRFTNTPIRIGVLSRFRTPKQQRETLAELAAGLLDIVIGTHRLTSKDVKFNNIGLIIIDEEQKFGVRVKEKIRAFKSGVDCLTLTATPIPRTLYLSLMGARDLSVINTPPQDRLPIKTVLVESDEEKIKAALLRELARNGQVYFIHNRIETIYDWATTLGNLVPEARIVVGHGQMSAEELDNVFHAFKSGAADILVATTIVENGIDIPNANTILIDRSDMYGLADLYQLRGRVGRWSRRAYAYFLLPKQRVIREFAEKRLNALLEIGGYGGGMKLAMRDLELRGAGNILGTEQSGHVSAVGFHLYVKMLTRTINALSGKAPHTFTETKLEFPQDARLPESYISDASLRMDLYGRFGTASTPQEVDEILSELSDRFGEPPEPALWLYHMMRIRTLAAAQNITALKLRKLTLQIEKPDSTRTVIVGPITTPAQLEEKITKVLTLS